MVFSWIPLVANEAKHLFMGFSGHWERGALCPEQLQISHLAEIYEVLNFAIFQHLCVTFPKPLTYFLEGLSDVDIENSHTGPNTDRS